MKHLLKLLDISGDEILDILNLGDQLKYEQHHGIAHPRLQGKTLSCRSAGGSRCRIPRGSFRVISTAS